MKILFTSDLHGLLEAYKNFSQLLKDFPYDVGVISGDLITGFRPEEFDRVKRDLGIEEEDLLEELHSPDEIIPIEPNQFLEKAYRQKEKEYKAILQSSGKPVLFIMGNDDGLVTNEWEDEGKVQNINQKRIDFAEINFVGYQYANPFVGGLFERTEKQQKRDMRTLRKLMDRNTILVTHGPAFGLNDKAWNPSKEAEHSIGSKALRWLIDKTKPKFHLYGHFHYGFGIYGSEINGAYPRERKFICIDTNSNHAEIVK